MLSGAVGQVAGRARGNVARAAHADRAQRPHARQQRAARPRRQPRQQRHQRGRILILWLPRLCRRLRVLAGLVLQGQSVDTSSTYFLQCQPFSKDSGAAAPAAAAASQSCAAWTPLSTACVCSTGPAQFKRRNNMNTVPQHFPAAATATAPAATYPTAPAAQTLQPSMCPCLPSPLSVPNGRTGLGLADSALAVLRNISRGTKHFLHRRIPRPPHFAAICTSLLASFCAAPSYVSGCKALSALSSAGNMRIRFNRSLA